ncbi:MAG: RloB domain-containing protein [Labilibaculum sp.]|nr:RloB domain-containing protein [Labilibaculum sp.]
MGGRKNKKLELRNGIFIVGEGITEQYYFTHLKQLKKYKCSVKPRFFGKTSIDEISRTVNTLLMGGVSVICIFDTDVSTRDAVENGKLTKFKKKYQKNDLVTICDTLPSIEFWFLLHFVKTNKQFVNTKSLEKELKKHLPDYNKTEGYLKNKTWVEQFIDQLNFACVNAKAIDQTQGCSYSNIFKAINLLEKKAKCGA